MRSFAQVLWDTINEGRFEEDIEFGMPCGCTKELGKPVIWCLEHEDEEVPEETPKRPTF